ncbi:hypothetical protein VSR01_25625 [Actinacidiphila sp. DG2A-62]|jgi:hypothetical protein|uniref:hypothetical protein n=1 Tax=Actinacidiphila sp. DG2A-62 TaxID=3108821 RepID=UPI002DB776F3|nr:hypothetical protein [Actinacidiphila sp. DG2A-62]MEC3996702.1 hypothetical protein [Actinacidiphila sp. DG2A-62]
MPAAALTPRGRRAAAGLALTAAVALAVTGCGGGGGGGSKDDPKPPSATAGRQAGGGTADTASPSVTPTQVLAQLKGEDDVMVTINSAVRDQDGFVTVQGSIANNGTSPFNAVNWMGQETALARSGPSVAGAVLVDEAGKKRYYVLRDTDGRCLCTMGLVGIKPKETRPFFAQFPAPPADTTQVDFELPTMPPAKITLSDGEG